LSAAAAHIVGNPAAAGVTPELLDDVRSACGELIPTVDVVSPGGREDTVRTVERLVLESDVPSVFVAVGGDGTVRDVAEGLARGSGRWPGAEPSGAEASLFVVPAGSGNSFYYALWERKPWQEALASLASPDLCETRAIDMIRLVDTDRSSVLGVNVGFGALVSEHLKRVGIVDDARHWAAVGAALEEADLFPATVTVDGEKVCEDDLAQVTIGGVKSFMRGNFQLLPRSDLSDGLLDVCIVANPTEEDFAELTGLMPQGLHLDHRTVTYVQGTRVQVERTDAGVFSMEHDGDPQDRTGSVNVEVVPDSVRAIADAALNVAGARTTVAQTSADQDTGR